MGAGFGAVGPGWLTRALATIGTGVRTVRLGASGIGSAATALAGPSGSPGGAVFDRWAEMSSGAGSAIARFETVAFGALAERLG